jgi:hypothetical protein
VKGERLRFHHFRCRNYKYEVFLHKMELIVWETAFDREYLIYRFQRDGLPDQKCHVHKRRQGNPQKHALTLYRDGVKILDKARGKCIETGLYHLPCQRYNTPCIMTKKEMTDRRPSESLPKLVTMVYGKVKVEWQLNPTYVPMRDYGPQKKSVYVYSPRKISRYI